MSWIVYKHTNKTNGKVYIGITSTSVESRWRNGEGYYSQEYFYKAIKKYGWEGFTHEVLFDNLTEEEARAKEIELIAQYKSNYRRYSNPNYGYNATDGGEGLSGYGKQVNQYDLHGNFIKTWYSIKEASEATNQSHSNIVYCCLGESHRAGEYLWEYFEENPPKQKVDSYWKRTGFKDPLELEQEKLVAQEKLRLSKIIIQYNKFGEEIGRWESIKEASEYLDISEVMICNACRGKTPRAGGYMWKYADEEKAKEFPIFYELIEQYTKDGHLIRSYSTATEACQETGINDSHICAVCKGKRKTAGGYVWKKITKQL